MTKKLRTHDGLVTSRKPLSDFGSLEQTIRRMRDHRPLDLSTEAWRAAHPGGTFDQWRSAARACLREGLHYDPPPCDLNAKTTATVDRSDFTLEFVEFDTTPWFRVEGCFLLPKRVRKPMPGLVVFHAWGGPVIFGKERMVDVGRDHPLLTEHRRQVFSERYLAEEYARRGYAVIVIDAFYFGSRAPRGLGGIPAEYDPFTLSIRDAVDVHNETINQLYLGVRQLNWAGTTWAGVNYFDDSRCVDYLLSRSEVDPTRIGCTGLSGGGYRTDMLAALDDRVKASVSVGWMTTGDHQQVYDLNGVIGTFCLLPGVWDRLDVPDLTIMAAPASAMVVLGTEDPLFPIEAGDEAARQIADGFAWAGCPGNFTFHNPPKVHCYDADIQAVAMDWLDERLKN